MLAPHRQSPNRARELSERAWSRVEQKLAGRKICGRCGAQYADFADLCTAGLDDGCPGSIVIAAAFANAKREEGGA